jgi:hypothetical protein
MVAYFAVVAWQRIYMPQYLLDRLKRQYTVYAMQCCLCSKLSGFHFQFPERFIGLCLGLPFSKAVLALGDLSVSMYTRTARGPPALLLYLTVGWMQSLQNSIPK